MGIPEDLLRNTENGCPNLTFAFMGGINSEILASFYNTAASPGSLSIPMYMRSMHTNATDYDYSIAAVKSAWQDKGFTLGTIAAFSTTSPTLYMTHDNPLIGLQLASYRASMDNDPAAFSDVYGLLDMAYAQGTTGGTLAGNFRNKMDAFGAIIPRLNAGRADLDLLDVTIGTYKDASGAVLPGYFGDDVLLAATVFNIPMWSDRGNSSKTAAAFAAGHGAGGVYLPLDNADFLANTFVLPMRLEFKVTKPGSMKDKDWNVLVNGGFENFSFNILKGGNVIPLTVPDGENADKFFYKRVSAYDPNTVYVSVNLAIKDSPYAGVETVVADSKTDLYSLNPDYLVSNPDPFPERGVKEQRGFFLFGDGSKDADSLHLRQSTLRSLRTCARQIRDALLLRRLRMLFLIA